LEDKVSKEIVNRKLTAAELPVGDYVESGTAVSFNTGSWRSIRPVWNKAKCIHCLTCWISCPDASIKIASDEKRGTIVTGIDYDHCKGCGICSKECPVKAITMEQERK
jgi:pyruvate ferredoxin oxidoreductase delta subunit